jgi:hypothetical protein
MDILTNLHNKHGHLNAMNSTMWAQTKMYSILQQGTITIPSTVAFEQYVFINTPQTQAGMSFITKVTCEQMFCSLSHCF